MNIVVSLANYKIMVLPYFKLAGRYFINKFYRKKSNHSNKQNTTRCAPICEETDRGCKISL